MKKFLLYLNTLLAFTCFFFAGFTLSLGNHYVGLLCFVCGLVTIVSVIEEVINTKAVKSDKEII